MKTLLKGLITIVLISLITSAASAQDDECKAKNEQFRMDKNAWIIQNVNEPFTQSDIAEFKSLFYYDIDCEWVLNGTLSVNPKPKVVNVGTSAGSPVQLYDYGTLSILIDGQQYNMQVYKNIDLPEFVHAPETIFVPIKDSTSGPKPLTTFGNGRYLIIEPPASGDQVEVDFNMAINPFENYNNTYPTLIVPDENVILAPVLTGERKYEDRTH